jgi:glutamate-1-semialdehyde 2,1-aminomutase
VPKSFAEKTIVLPYNDPEALESLFAARGEEIAAIIVESYPANAGLVFPKPGYLDLLSSITSETRRASHLRRSDDRLPPRQGGRAGNRKSNTRSELLRQGDRRRPAGRRFRRPGRCHGHARSARSRSIRRARFPETRSRWRPDSPSSRNSPSRPVIHAPRPAWRALRSGLRSLLTEKGVPHRLNRTGSMFCLFFTDREIVNVSDVMKQDLEFFKKLLLGLPRQGHLSGTVPL